MSRGATYERVYAELKRRILNGVFPPGGALEPGALSDELAASVTPIRDALHRLAGERLVESPRQDGFRLPIVIESGLRDLYEWNAATLNAALRAAGASAQLRGSGVDTLEASEDPAGIVAALFSQIARWTGNREAMSMIGALNDRLWSVRRVEGQIIGTAGEELTALREAVEAGEHGMTRRLVGRYHRVRLRAVPNLTALLMERYAIDAARSWHPRRGGRSTTDK